MKIDIEKLKEYIEESGAEVGEIDLGDKEVCDIKTNAVYLAEFYLKYFDEFNRIFKDCKIPEVIEILQKKDIYINLKTKSAYKNRDSCVCRSYYESNLVSYVNNNHFEIVEFFDFYREVVE